MKVTVKVLLGKFTNLKNTEHTKVNTVHVFLLFIIFLQVIQGENIALGQKKRVSEQGYFLSFKEAEIFIYLHDNYLQSLQKT